MEAIKINVRSMIMRFRWTRVVRAASYLVLVWVVVWLLRYMWSQSTWEYTIEIRLPPEADTSLPASFSALSGSPVVIVEEHYEVLKYWFAAAERSLIHKSGNVLLHIDGHSDGGIPQDIGTIPMFRSPGSVVELHNMMQRNDVFIVAAALGNLIDRYIWVWPPYDAANHEEDHVIIHLDVGSIEVTRSGSTVLELCWCYKYQGTVRRECFQRNSTDADGDGLLIDSSQCSLNRSGIVEVISEKQAIALLQTKDWITPLHNVILDIDEDYYGCESAGVSLYSRGVSTSVLDTLSDSFSNLFCARNINHESQVDTFFHSLVELVYRLKVQMEEKHPKKSKKHKYIAMQQILYEMLPTIFKNLQVENSLTSFMCGASDEANELFLTGIIRNIAPLSIPQLRSLGHVGMCLRFSPKSTLFDVYNSVEVCQGTNNPNSTLVLFHTPKPSEISERTEGIKMMLTSGHVTPSLVTVCRSVRDGYTPRRQARKIEADILGVLQDTVSKHHHNPVYYDKDLLGGAHGWYDRKFVFEETFIYKVLQNYTPR